jgi:hypothetical protein
MVDFTFLLDTLIDNKLQQPVMSIYMFWDNINKKFPEID